MKAIYHYLAIILLTACFAISCSDGNLLKSLDVSESMMEAHPDSALMILKSIDESGLKSKKEKARYALLMSMALDKNYIDRTSFEVLQPAIDYYLKKDNGTERLRTLYYQGRIFQNRGDMDSALNTFTKAIAYSGQTEDALYIAKTLVSQACMYYEFHDYENYTECHLRAANIYKNLSRDYYRLDCLLNALNGAIASGNKVRADSLMAECEKFNDAERIQQTSIKSLQFCHASQFEDIDRLRALLGDLDACPVENKNLWLNIALAYDKTGNPEYAKQILDNITGGGYDTLKYLAVAVPILEHNGNYKDALATYKKFAEMCDSINALRFDHKTKSLEEKHHLEIMAAEAERKNSRIIWSCIAGIAFLVMIVGILFLLFRTNKNQKSLALEQAKNSELENKRLKEETARIALANENLQLERDKKALEAEALSHRVDILENESATLKELIETQDELPSEVMTAIKDRIQLLNTLMAKYISNKDRDVATYEEWMRQFTENAEQFMDSNRLAFKATHPRFIKYFEDHNLTVREINYVCLYAIGLKGKEVGAYMKMRSHVNMSSAIRKKLGIDKHETNLRIYVRHQLELYS